MDNIEKETKIVNYNSEVACERLEITSGKVLIIDQFMPANLQFVSLISSNESELASAAKKYGGCVFSLPNGIYQVWREPLKAEMGLRLNAQQGKKLEDTLDSTQVLQIGTVQVDTKCLVFIDAEKLQDKPLITKYKDFRSKLMEKEARDLLRESGGAVRYGFSRKSECLGVYKVKEGEYIVRSV